MEKRFLNVDELSEYLGVKPKTIYAWVHIEYIPFVKFGRLVRFDVDEINKWIKGLMSNKGRSSRGVKLSLN